MFKMTEQVQQWTCIKFWVNLGHSSMETIHMIKKEAAMGNWWLAALSLQHAHSCFITSHAGFFFGKTSNYPGDSALRILAFLKTKITFKREEIPDHRWDLGKYDGAADGDWENCMRSHGTSEGDWGFIVLCTMFLVFSSLNVSIFHTAWLDIFWTDLISTI